MPPAAHAGRGSHATTPAHQRLMLIACIAILDGCRVEGGGCRVWGADRYSNAAFTNPVLEAEFASFR